METTEKDLHNAEQNKSSRRAAILMGGAALAGLALTRKTAEAQQGQVLDQALLNFALNLEFLEAQFYTLATQGLTIDKIGTPINVVGGSTTASAAPVTVKPTGYASCLVPFTTPLLQQYAMEVAAEERNHVLFLQSALGANAVVMPAIDLYNSFTALAVGAKLLTSDQVAAGAIFDPFASETNFLLGAFIFEDVGVTAYHGAAGLLTNKTYLDKAAGILAVEAYHAGSIRARIYAAGTDAQVASQAIANLRAAADGSAASSSGSDDIGVGIDANGGSTIVDSDANAIAFSRTTLQVRAIVYATGLLQQPVATNPPTTPTPAPVKNGTNKGGFFPNGLNGPIF